MPANLTILIPTWDRPQEVNQRLREINELWDRDVNVKIQVNPGKFSAEDIDTSLYKGPIEIKQNPQNIGLYASILCGTHGIQTEWLWILGDDDSLKPEAPAIIQEALQTCEQEKCDAILFNQWMNEDKQDHVICRTVTDFSQATAFSNALFISSNMWKTSFFNSHLRAYVEYSFSIASNVLLYIIALHEKSSAILVVNKSLIEYVYLHRWDRMAYLKRVFLLFRHPAVWEERTRVMEMLWPQSRWALQSAVHEQLKRGEAPLIEWIQSALEVNRFQFICIPPIKALRRTFEIWGILLEVYSIPKLWATIRHRLRKNLSGHAPTKARQPKRDFGF